MSELRHAPEEKDPRAKQVLVAVAVMGGLCAIIVIALTSWQRLPEIWAEWAGTMVGAMSTPFVLEASFIFIGLTIVIIINHWRQKRAGDDFVEVEVKDSEK